MSLNNRGLTAHSKPKGARWLRVQQYSTENQNLGKSGETGMSRN